MRKILYGLMSVSAVAIIGFAASSAFFSDTETSENNLFRSGRIDLRVGSAYATEANGIGGRALGNNPNNAAWFRLTDLKPGDTDFVDFQVQVIDNDAWVCAMGEITDGAALELAQEVQVRLVFPNHTPGPLVVGPTSLAAFALEGWQSFNDATPIALLQTANPDGSVIGSQIYDFELEYCFGTFGSEAAGDCIAAEDANDAQNQSVMAQLAFYAVQARNNEDFVCSGLNPVEPNVVLGSGWSAHDGDDHFFSKARSNNGGFEIAVGLEDDSVPGQSTADTTWVDGQEYDFVFEFDGVIASWTINGITRTFDVSPASLTNNRIGINAKATVAGTTTEVTNLTLNGSPLSPDNLVATASQQNMTITGVDLTSGFILEGTLTPTWLSNATEATALHIIVD